MNTHKHKHTRHPRARHCDPPGPFRTSRQISAHQRSARPTAQAPPPPAPATLLDGRPYPAARARCPQCPRTASALGIEAPVYLGVFDRVTFREARCRVPRIQSTVLCCCRRSNELTDVVLCLATGLIPRRIVSSITAGPHEGEVAGRVRGYVVCICVLDAIQSTAEWLGQADWGLGSIWVP